MIALLVAGCGPPETGREWTEPVDILDADGQVQAAGWARHPLFGFDRDAVPAELHGRLREWDFYGVYTPEFAMAATIAEIRLADEPILLASFSVHDYATGEMHGPGWFVLDDGHDFDPGPGGDYALTFPTGSLTYATEGGARVIEVEADDAVGRLVIAPPTDESVALVTPFAEPGHFFYENKALPMAASGEVRVGDVTYTLPVGESFAVLDFVRGVMPGAIDWEWATGLGVVDGREVAVNLGSVYGDESQGTPNAVIVDGVVHKLARVGWTYDLEAPREPWAFADAAGRVDLRLVADHDYLEHQHTTLGDYETQLWKLYGRFEGTVELDDGEVLVVDGLVGAAERMETRW